MERLISELKGLGLTVDAKVAADIVRVVHAWSSEEIKLDKTNHPFKLVEPFTYKMPDCEARRAHIGASRSPYSKVTVELVQALFVDYDTSFFGGMIQDLLKQTKQTLTIELEDAKGPPCQLEHTDKKYTLRVNTDLIHGVTPKSSQFISFGGTAVTSRIHAFQLVMENELLHLLIMLEGSHATEGKRGFLFKCMVENIFGREVPKHGSQLEVVWPHPGPKKYGAPYPLVLVRPGDVVSFISTGMETRTVGKVTASYSSAEAFVKYGILGSALAKYRTMVPL